MERPAKRLRLSEPLQRRCSRTIPWPSGATDCSNNYGDSSNVVSDNPSASGATTTPIAFSTSNPDPLNRVFPQLRLQFGRRDAVELRPRVPDTTVLATVVDVNVQSGSSTIATTILTEVSDATVVSFTSVGVLTVSAATTDTALVLTDASGSTISPSPSSSLSSTPSDSTATGTDSLNSITSSVASGSNSSATSTASDQTVTMTLTSTLNVAFVNGTVVTLSNPPNGASSSSTLANATDSASFPSSSLASSTLESGTAVLSTAGNGAGAASASAANGGAASPTSPNASATSTSSNSGGGPIASTPQVVGGVVGGVAGLALALLLVLFILRWWRARMRSRGELPEQVAARSVTSGGGSGTANQMSQRSSRTPLTAALLSSTRRWRPQSSGTTMTAATAVTSSTEPERGFQRIAGRKITPVIGSSRDQYGGNYGAFERPDSGVLPAPITGAASADARTATTSSRDVSSTQSGKRDLVGSSFYRDSRGFYGGRGGSAPPTPTIASSTTVRPGGNATPLASPETVGEEESVEMPATEPDAFAVMRPSPARTPVTNSPSVSSIRLPIQQSPEIGRDVPPTPALPTHLGIRLRGRDSVGRSHGSQDGSRSSRFTEVV